MNISPQQLNRLYVEAVRILPTQDLVGSFNLSTEMIAVIKALPDNAIDKLTDTPQLLVTVTKDNLCQLLTAVSSTHS